MYKRGHSYLLIFLMAIFLSACNGRPTAAQIKAEGQAYAEQSAADQAALNQQQLRQIEQDMHVADMSRVAYWQALWEAWKPWVFRLGQFTIACTFILAASTTFAFSRASWVGINALGDSFARFVTIRSGVVPLDRKTRLPRPFVYSAPENALPDSWAGRIQNRLGISVKHSRWNGNWSVVDTGSRQVIARLAENQDGNIEAMEINRQVLLASIMFTHMKESGMFSSTGEVAEAMANAHSDIPGQSLLMDNVKGMLADIVSGVRDDMAE